jgi:hypothetical protein
MINCTGKMGIRLAEHRMRDIAAAAATLGALAFAAPGAAQVPVALVEDI